MLLYTDRVSYIFLNILISLASINLGTIVGILGTVVIVGCLLFSAFVINADNRHIKRAKFYSVILFVSSILFLYFFVNHVVKYDDFLVRKFTVENIIRGGARDLLREVAFKNIKTYNITDVLLGKGFTNVYSNISKLTQSSNKFRMIEIDYYDLISSYGLILGGIFLIIPILFAVRFFKGFFRKKDILHYFLSLAMVLFLFAVFNAGHAYINILAMQIVVVLFFVFLKHMESSEEVKVVNRQNNLVYHKL
jgi:hypothetical protein